MRNYMKSEWYRILHTKDIYLLTGIMSGLLVLMNAILMISNANIKEFRYATVSFSLNTLLAGMPLLLICGGMIAGVLFAGERKTGIMKNAIAFGLSREKVFLGKSIISCLAGLVSMLVILFFYATSACLLLDGPIDIPLRELAVGISASLLCVFAATIFSVALFQYYEKEMLAYIVWFAVIFILPEICRIAGFRYEILGKIALWMPKIFLSMEVQANMGGYECLWDTPEGLMKCLVAGAIGIVVFLVGGLLINRKKNL